MQLRITTSALYTPDLSFTDVFHHLSFARENVVSNNFSITKIKPYCSAQQTEIWMHLQTARVSIAENMATSIPVRVMVGI